MIKSYIANEATDPTRFYDLSLLKHIVAIQSKSDFTNKKDLDKEMLESIEAILLSISRFTKSKIQVQKDSYGNMYVTKGEANSYPCVVSHVDTVHSIVKGRRVYQQNDILFCFSDDEQKQVGTGGDDKVGIFVNLQALLDFDNIKAVFYRNEEIGHLGSKYSMENNTKFYKDCNFILQCDRKGSTDFLTTSAGVKLCSAEFINNVKPYVEKYGFTVRDIGISTDVDTLVSKGVGVSCANISSGYHYPHTDREVINVKEVGKTYALVFDIIDKLGTTRFEHKHIPKVYNFDKGKTSSNKNSDSGVRYHGTFPYLDAARGINNVPLKGMYDIIIPKLIITKENCPKCKSPIFINTDTNRLQCRKCNANMELLYPDWHEDMIVTFEESGRKKQYVYSWMYNSWTDYKHAVFMTENNINTWVSKELYEEDQKNRKGKT